MFVAGGSASRQGGPRVRSAKLQDRDAVALSFALDDKGILPDRMIAALAAAGGILSENQFVPDQIQPASLDLRLGEVAYRVRASFLPGPHHGCPAHRRAEAARGFAHRWCGAGDRLRLHRAVAGKPGPAGRDFRRGQSQKFDRPARRVHSRDCRRNARLRSYRGWAITGRFMPKSAREHFPCWCAKVRGFRKFVSAAAMRCLRREALRAFACARAPGRRRQCRCE